jgi:hypothetical protein
MAQARYANASFWDIVTVTPRLYEVRGASVGLRHVLTLSSALNRRLIISSPTWVGDHLSRTCVAPRWGP